MAPTRQKNTAKIVEQPSSSEAEYDPSQPDASQSQSQQSQEIPADTLKKLLDKTKQQNIKRRQKKEEEIETNRRQAVQEVQRKIEACHQEHQEKLRALRQPQIQRLRELLQEKQDVEKQLDQCYATIDQSYSIASEQIQAAVTDKINNSTE
ncbi:hypothetical protein AC579_3736 [Pseudocercospora musae]|uniref:Uncharacterized protein n=1 Tax=Pseudocercospora musae TaxID=113226 RepID=A0A139I695_9PEZI|nr:hypothetical protein AC579_3736 [Pseudocercospora musae]